MTEHTITDVEDYLSELDAVRGYGYAIDDRENELDGRCVAVPVPGGRLPLALSVSAPAARFPMEQVPAVAAALTTACSDLFELLGPRGSAYQK